MALRAFIVAVEKYDKTRQKLAAELAGTNASALAFREWCISKKKVEPANIYFCAGVECPQRTTGNSRLEIKNALGELLDTGKNDTQELYFFFSGHGFSYPTAPFGVAVDVLVGSEFETMGDSGDACLKLQDIRQVLWYTMGRGEHYYFIDACRIIEKEDEISPGGLGFSRGPSELGRPSTYMLFSTRQGDTASVKSGFAPALVQGLSGNGRSKAWIEGRLRVTFDQLFRYMKSQLQDQLADPERKGPGDGVILEFSPVPKYQYKIIVDNADLTDAFTLNVKTMNEAGDGLTSNFQGAEYPIKLPPNDYYLQVFNDSAQVVQIQPPPKGALDLFDPLDVHFLKQNTPPAALPETGSVTFASFPTTSDLKLTLENVHTEAVRAINLKKPVTTQAKKKGRGGSRPSHSRPRTGRFSKVQPGRYRLKVERQGLTVHTEEVEIAHGEKLKINVPGLESTSTRERLIRFFSNHPAVNLIDAAKTLGPISDWDLSLLLSLLGALRILSEPANYRNAMYSSLESFEGVEKDASYVYVLAGLEKTSGELGIALSDGPHVSWESGREVRGLSAVVEWRARSSAGSHLLSVRLPEQSPLTFAVYCLPNRATFVSLTENAAGRLSMHQFLLPIYNLKRYLPPRVLEYLSNDPMQVVQMMFLAQSRFAQDLEIAPESNDNNTRNQWLNVLYQKWLDPVMTLVASYELIRRGEFREDSDRRVLKTMIGNLRKYFTGIPDIEAIAKMTGEKWELPENPPLLLDGTLAFGDESQLFLSLDENKLDYGNPWTTWRGAVDSDTEGAKLSSGNLLAEPDKRNLRRPDAGYSR